MLVSAALLFFVEPMFAKMVLPRLGGSPAVWNTCVVFFQGAMLAGYAYSHVITRRLRLWQQIALHGAVLVAVALSLPIAIPEGWAPPVDRTPVPALLGLLLTAIGAPFFAVAATAPLVQKWLSHTDHPSATDPYFLYAASNAGSIVALLGYPLIAEPMWTLSFQSQGWTAGYLVLAILIGACASAVWCRRSNNLPAVARSNAEPRIAEASVTWLRRARWMALAFVPSSLMLAVTTFVSTDIAAVPLLWIAPLTIYLLSFVIAFATRRVMSERFWWRSMAILLFPLTFAIIARLPGPLEFLIPLHLAAFFACAVVLHRELARDRPTTRHLTEFYLWLSIGGVLGGAFNTFLAPYAFADVIEYPAALILACALSPRTTSGRESRAVEFGLPLGLGAGALAIVLLLKTGGVSPAVIGVAAALVVIYWACSRRPLRLACGLALVFLVGFTMAEREGDLLHAERTFFGVLRVRAIERDRVHALFHGSTIHGEQSVDPVRKHEPGLYYSKEGPVGQLFAALSDRFRRVGVIGLGTGTMAVYATPNQHWTFYEIDPAVERIARTSRFFTYLDDCGTRCNVVLGDARLSLARESGQYDAIILDAFSSDAVPVHLLTKQALQLYLERLSKTGVLAFHISNRHLGLRPVIGALTHDVGLSGRVQLHRPRDSSNGTTSEWVVMARSKELLGTLATDSQWQELAGDTRYLWTDDYSNILSVLARR